MKIFVVGVDYDEGVYNDKPYSNVLLTTLEVGRKHKNTITHGVGFDVNKNPVYKVKNNFAERVATFGNNVTSFDELLGCQVDFAYDRYGSIDTVKILKVDALLIAEN